MEFISTRTTGVVTVLHDLWVPPSVQEILYPYIHRWRDGTQFRHEIVRIGNPGSYQQLKTIFGLAIARILMEFEERGIDMATLFESECIPPGFRVTKDALKLYLYARVGYVSDDGDPKTLSEMDTVERSRFFEEIRIHAAGKWGIQIPDPDPFHGLEKHQ